MNRYLFINGSPNKNGRTARMAAALLSDKPYETVNLVDYRIAQLGQTTPADQFLDVIGAMQRADSIVIGSPVYWHTMSGLLKTVIDRFYELGDADPKLDGKKLFFIFQGEAPTELTKQSTIYIINRLASLTGMELMGTATTESEITELKAKL